MRATARAQPNIALVKYWGKRDVERNLPAVGSLSVTLESLWTEMSVAFSPALERDRLTVNGEPSASFLPRVSACLDHIAGSDRSPASVESVCNFPIAAGLASSAASFAALSVAASAASGRDADTLALARAAGRASGSAARSLYGGIVELRVSDEDIEVASVAAPDDWTLSVVVAVTERGPKPVSSGQAMIRSAQTSPFYGQWVADQNADLDTALSAVAARDFLQLAEVSEFSCLKMHSVMWTSRPPITYWNAATLACMEVVRQLRSEGVPVFFTVDAGPQVKAVCLPGAEEEVAAAVAAVPGVTEVMRSGLGHGAKLCS